MQLANITLFATADWDNPFWTNKQHVAKTFAEQGYRVLYIESVGLRAPTATAADAGRILRRLKKAFRFPQQVVATKEGGAVYLLSPLVIPLQKYGWVRRLNRLVLFGSVALARRWLKMKPDWLWTYNPLTLELLPVAGYRRVIYHCVDAIETQPGMPTKHLMTAEAHLARQAHAVFCTSNALYERHKSRNKNCHYFANVADELHFSKVKLNDTRVPEEVLKLRALGPVLGFVGAISRYKQDFSLLVELAKRQPSWQIVLIGKVGEGDPEDNALELVQQPNIHLLGPRSYEQLPSYLKGFDVCLLPTQRNEYTRNMFPMKFYEYLMAGKDVVAININSLQALTAFYYPASNLAEFEQACQQVLRGETKQSIALQTHLSQCTYRARNERMLQLISSEAL